MKEFTKTNLDKVGEVFIEEGKIIRKINNEYRNHVKYLFECGFIDELIQKGLFVDSKLIQKENDLFVEHQLLEPIIYPYEWTFSMLKISALKFIEIAEIARKYQIGLHDCHSSNFVFHQTNPVYVDLGSFAYSYFLFPLREYVESYLFPLILWNLGLETTIKYALTWKTIFPVVEFFLIIDPELRKHNLNMITHSLKEKYPVWTPNVDLLSLKNHLEPLKLKITTEWGDYNKEKYDENGNFIITDRFQKIINYTSELCSDCKTAVSLGGNNGAFENELLKKTNIERVIVQDFDSKALEDGFEKYAYRMDGKQIYFANYDLIWTVSHPYWQPPEIRFKSDVLYALALTHHLMLGSGVRLNFIFEVFKKYTKKFAFIEFMPLGLWAPGAQVNIPNWYTEEYFQRHFKIYFEIIWREQLEPNRILYIGKLKK
ncbi:MAG: hypothetical protein ACP5RR_01245 [Candidatus Kapaibacteriota bacterium]